MRRTVAIPVALLGLLAIVLVIEILTLTASLRLVDHADLVITNARQAMRNMVDMESSARGFELTGDERFLQTFKSAESQAPSSVDALTQLTADNPAQQARVREIRQLDEEWLRWAEHEIAEPSEQKADGGRVNSRRCPDGANTKPGKGDCRR